MIRGIDKQRQPAKAKRNASIKPKAGFQKRGVFYSNQIELELPFIGPERRSR
jgi:hypothetical protein